MARHIKTSVWATARTSSREWAMVSTADRSHLDFVIKSADTLGQVSTRVTRRTALAFARQILACLEDTK